MIKKLTALAALVLLLLTQRPQAQGPVGTANIYFVDIGTGASTLIVSPTGKTLLVDGGPDGSAAKITALMDTLGIATIDSTVVTHYHIDHISGITELINAGKVQGTAFDNGDGADVQPPGTSTSPASTRGHYLNYKSAITAHPVVTRATVVPGTVIDLGGGMRATFLAAGGRLLSGGQAAITNDDLNSESISVLVEFNNFDYLVSGDLTGGGSTSTAKTPDIETYVGQMVGDVDVVQLDHHGSTTANNQTFLGALKAEVAFAQTGETNTFGHPNRETANKYLNTPTTAGNTFAGTDVPPAGVGPVFYQNEASSAGDDRVTRQGYTGTGAGTAGQGTILLSTDGTTTYSLTSFDDAGARLPAGVHTYAVDGVSAGVTTDFKPTVIAQTTPVVPLAADSVLVSAQVNDRESPIASVVLAYSLDGVAQSPVTMTLAGSVYQGTIPAQPDATRVDYAITASAGTQTTTYASGYFAGVSPVSALHTLNAKGEPLFAGYPARIQGTVTASGFSAGTNDDYVQDASGAVNVYRSTDTPTPFTSLTPGQRVEAFGRINFNGGRLRLDLTESLEKVTSPFGVTVLSNEPAPTPLTTTIATLNANPESFEGQFVSIANCVITSGTIPATAPFDAFVTISDGTGSFSLKIDHDTDVAGFTPSSPFTTVGIIQQDDFLRPFDSGYDVTPRSRVDLGAGAPTPPALVTIGEARIDEVSNSDGTPGADFIPDRLNQVVRVQGVVSSIDFRGGNGIEYYIQDATGGIDLFSTTLNATFAIGDTIEATGSVTQFNGLTELTVSAVSLITPSGAAPTPVVVTLSQLAAGNGEAFEGQLIRIDNVTITGGLFPAANASGNVTIADATGTGTLRVDSDTNIDGTPTPSGVISVTGLLGQFSPAPFDSGYQLLPRFLTDIVSTGGGPALSALPGTLAFPPTTVGNASVAPVSISNNGTSPLTLTTPFTITGTDASQFSVGAPGATTLTAGASTTVSVTFLPTTAGDKSATLTIASDVGSATVALTGTGQTGGGGGGVVISELRTRGPSGGNDEFVEIYNNSDSPVDISGWKLNGSSATAPTGTRATVPAGVVLPPRRHYLFFNSTATTGYSGSVPGNVGYVTGIADAGGAALTDAANNIIDQVGIATTAAAAYHEGTPLATQLATNVDRAYQRKPGDASVTLNDTDDNSADFQIVVPSNPQDLVITAAPGSVDFGSVASGDTRSQTITIKNQLQTSVTLNAPFSITDDASGSFSVAAPSTTTLTAGATATVNVTFSPSSSGAKTASLVITSTLGGSILVPLQGVGTAGLFVSPSSVDFGTATPGSSVGATVTIGNSDATSATLTPPFAITGTNAADFSAGAPGVTVLPGGGTTSVAVSFQPAGPGPKSATLQITSVGGTTRTVSLTGVGTCAAITVSATLPQGRVGTAYAGIVSASGDAGPFTFTLSGGSLPDGLTIASSGNVSGTPTTAGSSTFTVLASEANGCSGSASFTIAVAPAVLTAAPTTVDFGVVAVPSSATQTITFTNNTAGPITLSTPFAITGADAAVFSVGAPATTTLAGGASTTAPVTFTPAAAGPRAATLTATSSSGGFATVVLTGAGSVATPIVISEIRFRGPLGGNDELVEIYNNSDAPIDISGWKLLGSSNTAPTGTRATVPSATILPARTHYLFVNTAANGYSGTVPGNVWYTTGFGDNGGVALTRPDNTIVDQVGVQTTGTAYREGSPIPTQLTTNTDRGYERKPGHGSVALQDTDTNALDFVLVAPTNAQSLGLTTGADTLDFGALEVGQTASLGATIKNNLLVSVALTTPFTIDGADAASFSVAAPAATTLANGESTTAAVTFTPSAVGAKNASLQIASSGGPAAVALRGSGVDTTAPTLTVPAPITTEATGPTTIVPFTTSSVDLVDPAPVIGCVPVSGFAFPVATTTVECTATDAAGNAAHASFTVTVTDHTAPALTLPGNPTATATSPAGATVNYSATAVDLVDGSRPFVCAPASGSTFPIGTTTVNCSASDTRGNTASGSFTVTVNTADEPGRMIGNAEIEVGAVTHSLDFFVQERASGADAGALRYTVKTTKKKGRDDEDRFDSTVITSVTFFNVPGVSPGRTPPSGIDTVSFTGRGRWNGQSGFTFEAVASDAGEPGRGRDRFSITIRGASGQIVASVNAIITQGNIQSLRILR